MSFASSLGWNERAARVAALVVVAAAVVPLARYVYLNAPVVPLIDGWRWIQTALEFDHGGMAEVMRTNRFNIGIQIYTLPSAIALAVGPLIDYSFRPFAFVTIALLVGLGALFYAVARHEGLGPLRAAAVFVAVASMRHFSNLLLGFQFGIVLSIAGGALAIVVADRRRDGVGLAWATALAIASILSSSGGVFAAVAVVAVRATARESRWRWLYGALIAIAVFAAVEALALRFGHFQTPDFVRTLPERLRDDFAGPFLTWLDLLGGALAGGPAQRYAGIAVATASALVLVDAALRRRRVDAIAGLVLFSMLGTLAIGLVRPRVEVMTMRHAIMAAPAVGACLIRLLALAPAQRALRAVGAAVVAAALIAIEVQAHAEARVYVAGISQFDADVRLALAARPHGRRLVSDTEIKRVHWRDTELDYVRERGWMIFSPHYHGIVASDALPATFAAGAVRAATSDASLAFDGPGYVYTRYRCEFPSGCAIRESVDMRAEGQATIGFIVRGADGAELRNVIVPVEPAASWIVPIAKTTLAPGETADAYVWSAGARAAVRASSVVVVTRSARSER